MYLIYIKSSQHVEDTVVILKQEEKAPRDLKKVGKAETLGQATIWIEQNLYRDEVGRLRQR